MRRIVSYFSNFENKRIGDHNREGDIELTGCWTNQQCIPVKRDLNGG